MRFWGIIREFLGRKRVVGVFFVFFVYLGWGGSAWFTFGSFSFFLYIFFCFGFVCFLSFLVLLLQYIGSGGGLFWEFIFESFLDGFVSFVAVFYVY